MTNYKYYDKTHPLMNGQILLYTRKDQKRPKWWMRLNIPKKKGYVVRSTGCFTLHEAISIAENTYFDLKHKVERNLPITRTGFKKIFEQFYSEMCDGHRLSVHRLRVFRHMGKYWCEFFGHRLLERLESDDLEQYRIWRLNYWTTGAGAELEKPPNVALVPAINTIKMDRQCLNQFLKWAKSKKLIDVIPTMKLPRHSGYRATARRPTFTDTEWNKLTSKLRWYTESKESKALDDVHRWQRFMIRHAVLIIANSGLRPQEASQLKWWQVENNYNKEKDTWTVLISIPEDSKTGSRLAVCTDGTYEYFQRLKSQSNHTSASDYVFCSHWGERQKNWGKTFKALLRQWGLLVDPEGRDRTIYSLRHFYITKRLENGIPVHLVANICGTSIQNIEKHYFHATVRADAEYLAAKKLKSKLLDLDI